MQNSTLTMSITYASSKYDEHTFFANAEHGSDDAFSDVNFIASGNELQYNCNGKFREKRFRRARAEIETVGAFSQCD